jgi:hypothetical protein
MQQLKKVVGSKNTNFVPYYVDKREWKRLRKFIPITYSTTFIPVASKSKPNSFVALILCVLGSMYVVVLCFVTSYPVTTVRHNARNLKSLSFLSQFQQRLLDLLCT